MKALLTRTVLSVAALALVMLLAPSVFRAQDIAPETRVLLQFTLSQSYKSVDLSRAAPGDSLQYTIRVINDSPLQTRRHSLWSNERWDP